MAFRDSINDLMFRFYERFKQNNNRLPVSVDADINVGDVQIGTVKQGGVDEGAEPWKVKAEELEQKIDALKQSIESGVQLKGSDVEPINVQLSGSNVALPTDAQRRSAIPVGAVELLTTPTYDGSGQAMHPVVIRPAAPVSGYSYWMAMTPYPKGAAQHENPSILASNDGVTWVVPAGLTNPVVPPPDTGYNSDPYLLHDGTKFYLYWREVVSGTTTLKVKTSNDGITWSDSVACTIDAGGMVGVDPMSPSIIRHTSTFWTLTFRGERNRIYRCISADGITWGTPRPLIMNIPSFCYLWHGIVTQDMSGFSMLLGVRPTNAKKPVELLYGYSKDGYVWNFDDVPFLTRRVGSFFSANVYTGCIVDVEGASYAYVSGSDVNSVWRTGRVKISRNNSDWSGYAGMSKTRSAGESLTIPAGETAYITDTFNTMGCELGLAILVSTASINVPLSILAVPAENVWDSPSSVDSASDKITHTKEGRWYKCSYVPTWPLVRLAIKNESASDDAVVSKILVSLRR